jgi:hypothetical protein
MVSITPTVGVNSRVPCMGGAVDTASFLALPGGARPAGRKQTVCTCLRNAPNSTNARFAINAGKPVFRQPHPRRPTPANAQIDRLKIRPVSVRVRPRAQCLGRSRLHTAVRTPSPRPRIVIPEGVGCCQGAFWAGSTSMWTALNRPRCQGGAPAAQRGRTTLTTGPRGSAHARLESKSLSIGYVVVVQRLHGDAYGFGGRAETSAAGHPFAPARGHGAVRVQHAGSFTTATTPRSGGQTIARPRACCVRDAHAATGRWTTARMCPSRSP